LSGRALDRALIEAGMLEELPPLEGLSKFLLQSFLDLSSFRAVGMGIERLNTTDVLNYHNICNWDIEPIPFMRAISQLDEVYVEHQVRKMKNG